MKIILARNIGFCFGVERAYNLSIKALEEEKSPCYMLGMLVHNENVVEELCNKGLKFVQNPLEVQGGTVIIRAHGVGDATYSKLEAQNVKIIDATCPLVRKACEFACDLYSRGREVIIIGEKGHAEVEAINGSIKNKGIVVESEEEIENLSCFNPGVVIQTTQNQQNVGKITNRLKKRFGEDLEVGDTLCNAVGERQKETKELLGKVDVVLVVGSRNSANTMQLYNIAKKRGYLVEDPEEIEKEWIKKAKKVGIISGTSASRTLVEQVVQKVKTLSKC